MFFDDWPHSTIEVEPFIQAPRRESITQVTYVNTEGLIEEMRVDEGDTDSERTAVISEYRPRSLRVAAHDFEYVVLKCDGRLVTVNLVSRSDEWWYTKWIGGCFAVR